MGIIAEAKKGLVSPLIRRIARREGVAPEAILRGLAAGTVVVPANRHRKPARACGIGAGLSVKVNANIGMSPSRADPRAELRKARAAAAAGADALMDLSVGGDANRLRRRLLAASELPLGTVPIYQAALRAGREKGRITAMTADSILGAIEEQAREGVDFMTVHAGVNAAVLETIRKHPRLLGVVSRGGAFLLE